MQKVDDSSKFGPQVVLSRRDPGFVKKLFELYMHLGIEDVKMNLYEGCRHEILNETDKQVVFEDLLAWMNVRIDT